MRCMRVSDCACFMLIHRKGWWVIVDCRVRCLASQKKLVVWVGILESTMSHVSRSYVEMHLSSFHLDIYIRCLEGYRKMLPGYTACCNFLAYRVCAECSTDYLTKYVTIHHLLSFYQAPGGDVLKPPPTGTYRKLCSPLILLNFSTSVTASQPRLIKRTRIRFQLHRWWDPLELRIPWRDQGAALRG